MFKDKKVTVTGGAGFIGSHIADELTAQGARVIILDNLSSGRIENIQHLISARQVEFIEGSITDLSLLQRVLSGADYVFHEAAISSVPISLAKPGISHETNLTGTLNVLIAARDNKVKKVVLASSAAVYGDSPAIFKKEDQIPAPLSPYAVNKLAGEYYCDVFNKAYRLPTICLRYFNVYGPRQHPDSDYAAVIPKFIQRISAGEDLVIYGDGEQTRDFVFVKDVVSANLLAAQSKATGVFNIGTGEKISVNKLSETIRQLMGQPDLQVIHEAERPGDIKHSLADISEARNIGYIPRYTLQSGLQEMLKAIMPEKVKLRVSYPSRVEVR